MTDINPESAIPLAGGELFSGITFTLALQMLYQHGFNVSILNDKKRQILLNCLCLLCSVNTMISYGFNATRVSVLVSDITTMITFLCVQYSLVILNHNTIIRSLNLFNMQVERKLVDRVCLVLYFLPWLVLVPIYLAVEEKAGSGHLINTSEWNKTVYKPFNIGLIVITEILATVTDILLIRKVQVQKARLQELSNSHKIKPSTREAQSLHRKLNLSNDILVSYIISWLLIFFDIIVKILIICGFKLFFDSIITITTVALRTRSNLQFGLELQTILKNTKISEDSIHESDKISVENQNRTDRINESKIAHPVTPSTDGRSRQDSNAALSYYYGSSN